MTCPQSRLDPTPVVRTTKIRKMQMMRTMMTTTKRPAKYRSRFRFSRLPAISLGNQSRFEGWREPDGCAEDSARYGCCKNCNRIFLLLETRVSITDTRDATGVVAHRNHCVRIFAVCSDLVAIDCAHSHCCCRARNG